MEEALNGIHSDTKIFEKQENGYQTEVHWNSQIKKLVEVRVTPVQDGDCISYEQEVEAIYELSDIDELKKKYD